MKLHLPRVLFIAIMATMSPLALAQLTIDSTTNVASDGDWSKTFDPTKTTYLTGTLASDWGNRMDITSKTDQDLGESIVIANNKQLFLQTYQDTSPINVAGSIYVGHNGGIRVGMDHQDVTMNSIYLTGDASIYENAGLIGHTVTINGTVTDKVPTNTEGTTYDSTSTLLLNGGKYVFTGTVDVENLVISDTKTTQVTFDTNSTLVTPYTNITNNGTVSFKNCDNISDILNQIKGTGAIAIERDTLISGSKDTTTEYNFAGKIQVKSGATLTIGQAKTEAYNSLWTVNLEKSTLNLQGGTATIYGGASKLGTILVDSAESTLELHATKQNGGTTQEVRAKELKLEKKLTITGQWESKLRIDTLNMGGNTLHLNAHTEGDGKDATVTIGQMTGSHNGMLQAENGNYILEKAQHTIGTLDASKGNAYNDTVTLKEGASLAISQNLWLAGNQQAKIILEKDASLTKGDVLKVIGRGNTSTLTRNANVDKAEDDNVSDLYNINDVSYIITDADVEVKTTENETTTLRNILNNVTLVNSGNGALVASNDDNHYSGLVARTGNIEVSGFANNRQQTSLSLLEIAAEKTITINSGNGDNISLADVEVSGQLITGADSVLNANLSIKGGTVTMNGTLTLGGSLELGTGLTLGGDLFTSIMAMTADSEPVLLFTGVTELTLGAAGDARTIDVLSEEDEKDLNTWFSNVQAGTYYLSYDATSGNVYAEMVATVPEPTTATLSLLALCGLAMRRRRK